MSKEITRLLQEIGATQSMDELAAIASIASEIDDDSYDQEALAHVIDALREAREWLAPNE